MLTWFFRSLTHSLTLSLAILSLGSIGGALWVIMPEHPTALSVMESVYAAPDPNTNMTSAIPASTSAGTAWPCKDGTQNCFNKENDATGWIKALNALIAFVSMLYVPLSLLGGWLLSSEWTYGDVIGIRPVFHSLWVFVSNFVYVAFAGMLVIVAIANIFGQSDSYAIKKMLPRFIIGVIMVPLTWFGVSAILSLTNYATAIVLRLPADTITAVTPTDSKNTFTVEYPTKCTFDFTGSGWSTEVLQCSGQWTGSLSDVLTNSSRGAYGILPYYAYSIFEFGKMTQFKSQLQGTEASMQNSQYSSYSNWALIITTLGKIGIQLGLKVVFFVVFMVILIMLVFVMLLRMIRMWFYIIFSPLFALRFFLGDKVGKESPLNSFSFTDFIGLALIPVYVSAALGFGLMFLTVFKDRMYTSTLSSDIITKSTDDQSGFRIFGTTDIEIKVLTGTTEESASNIASVTQDGLAQLLGSLITPILGIIVLWLAVLAAAKSSTITKEAVSGFENAGKMVGDVAKKVPGMMPIPGSGAISKALGGSGKWISINQSLKIPDMIKEIHQKHLWEEADALRSSLGITTAVKEFTAELTAAGADLTKNFKALGNGLGSASLAEQHANTRAQKWAVKFFDNLGAKDPTMVADLESGDKSRYLKGMKTWFGKILASGRVQSNSELYTKMQEYDRNPSESKLIEILKLMQSYGWKPAFTGAAYASKTIKFQWKDSNGNPTDIDVVLTDDQIAGIKNETTNEKKRDKLRAVLNADTDYSNNQYHEASDAQLDTLIAQITTP